MRDTRYEIRDGEEGAEGAGPVPYRASRIAHRVSRPADRLPLPLLRWRENALNRLAHGCNALCAPPLGVPDSRAAEILLSLRRATDPQSVMDTFASPEGPITTLARDLSLWTNPTVGGWLPAMPEAPGRPQGPLPAIYLIRHAHTSRDLAVESGDVITGWQDVPLDAEGKREARAMAKRIAAADLGIDNLYCSDLTRAQETARVLAEALGFSGVNPSEMFRPWDMGTLVGTPVEDAREALEGYVRARPSEEIPGGESFNAFRGRFLSALFGVMRSPGGPVAIVTHSRNLELARAWLDAAGPPSWEIVADTFLAFDSYPAEVLCLVRDELGTWRCERSSCEALQPGKEERAA